MERKTARKNEARESTHFQNELACKSNVLFFEQGVLVLAAYGAKVNHTQFD
jgi:hypothetical protein